MVLTPAEKSRRYRERLKEKAQAGDKHAIELLEKKREKSRTLKSRFSTCLSYIRLHATREEIEEIKKVKKKKKKRYYISIKRKGKRKRRWKLKSF